MLHLLGNELRELLLEAKAADGRGLCARLRLLAGRLTRGELLLLLPADHVRLVLGEQHVREIDHSALALLSCCARAAILLTRLPSRALLEMQRLLLIENYFV